MLLNDVFLRAIQLTGNERGLSVSGLIHLVPFLMGNRNACRLVLGTVEATLLARELKSNGRATILKPLERAKKGEDWLNFTLGSANSDYQMLVTSTNPQIAENVIDAEFSGNSRVSGKLLGYPLCCVTAYDEISDNHKYWPNFYLKQTNYISPWCNRFALLWGGCCPTGELFPCSLNCKQAIAMGKNNINELKRAGLGRLALMIWHQANEPLSLDSNGRIIKNSSVTTTSDTKSVIIRCE